jgi:outer membrane protein TolC
MSRARSIIILAAALIGSAGLTGLEARADEEKLDFSRALALAIENSAELASFESRLQATEREAQTANDRRDPQLRLSHENNRRREFDPDTALSSGEDWSENSIALRIYPRNPLEVRAIRRGFAAERALIEDERKQCRYGISTNAAAIFIDIDFLKQELELLLQARQIETERQSVLERMQSGGQPTRTDKLRSVISAMELAAEWQSLAGELAERIDRLEALTGLDGLGAEQIESVELDSEQIDEAADIDELLAGALRSRIEYLEPAHAQSAARAELRAARARWLPWPEHIQGSYRDRQRFEDDYAWEVQASFALPFFNYDNDSDDFRAAQAESRAAEMRAARALIRDEIKAGLRAVARAGEELDSLREATRAVLAEIEQLTGRDDALATLGADDYFDFKAARIETARALLAAEHRRDRAILQLHAAAGLPVETPADQK